MPKTVRILLGSHLGYLQHPLRIPHLRPPSTRLRSPSLSTHLRPLQLPTRLRPLQLPTHLRPLRLVTRLRPLQLPTRLRPLQLPTRLRPLQLPTGLLLSSLITHLLLHFLKIIPLPVTHLTATLMAVSFSHYTQEPVLLCVVRTSVSCSMQRLISTYTRLKSSGSCCKSSVPVQMLYQQQIQYTSSRTI